MGLINDLKICFSWLPWKFMQTRVFPLKIIVIELFKRVVVASALTFRILLLDVSDFDVIIVVRVRVVATLLEKWHRSTHPFRHVAVRAFLGHAPRDLAGREFSTALRLDGFGGRTFFLRFKVNALVRQTSRATRLPVTDRRRRCSYCFDANETVQFPIETYPIVGFGFPQSRQFPVRDNVKTIFLAHLEEHFIERLGRWWSTVPQVVFIYDAVVSFGRLRKYSIG